MMGLEGWLIGSLAAGLRAVKCEPSVTGTHEDIPSTRSASGLPVA